MSPETLWYNNESEPMAEQIATPRPFDIPRTVPWLPFPASYAVSEFMELSNNVKDRNSLVKVPFPALLHNLDQPGLDFTAITIPWVHERLLLVFDE